jgi:hypothetical protein
MAKKISETPILYGSEAKMFLDKISSPQKVTNKEKIRIKNNYQKIKKIAEFT